MRISSLPSSAAIAAAFPSNANAIVNTGRDSLIVPVPLSCFIVDAGNRCRSPRDLRARPFQEVAAGLGELAPEALDQFGHWWRVRDLADALTRAPDVAPRLGLGVAARTEIHLRLVAERQIVGIEPCGHDRRAEIVAVH